MHKPRKWRTATFYEACKFIQGRTPIGIEPSQPLEECVNFADGSAVWCHNSAISIFPDNPVSGCDIDIANPKFSIYDPMEQGDA